MAFHALADYPNHVIGWLQWEQSSLGDGAVVRFPRICMSSGECRFKRTTDSTHAWPVAPNLLDQDFAAEAPDQKWSADISYIWTAEGWLYLAVLIDLFSRRVVGWAVSDRLKKDLALRALRMALVTRHPPSGLIHHSDRGSQYCSILAYPVITHTHYM